MDLEAELLDQLETADMSVFQGIVQDGYTIAVFISKCKDSNDTDFSLTFVIVWDLGFISLHYDFL